MKNNYVKPKNIIIDIDETNIICLSNGDISLPNNWYMDDDGHIYNPGGHDMCDKFNRPHDLWGEKW